MEGFEVAGRRFRTEADYKAALRDKTKIDAIKARVNMEQPGEVITLCAEMEAGKYRFETTVGTDFDDEIYELAQEFKRQGYHQDSKLPTGKKKSLKGKKRSAKEKKKTGGQPRTDSAKVSLDAYDKNMQKEILHELKKREKRRKLTVFLCSVVAVVCFGYFGVYYYFSDRTQMDYENLAQLKGNTTLAVGTPAGVTIHYTEEEEIALEVLEEYQTLYSKNKSLIGWLKIDDTNIDYPVMQTSNNEYYLDHNYSQEYDKNGVFAVSEKSETAAVASASVVVATAG